MGYDDVADYMAAKKTTAAISPGLPAAISLLEKKNPSPQNGSARISQKQLLLESSRACQCRVHTVALVGNIGAGKTSILTIMYAEAWNLIEQGHLAYDAVELAFEEVDAWTKVKTADGQEHNLLKLYYEDQLKEATRFQNNMLMQRLRQQLDMDERIRAACPSSSGGACSARHILRIAERTAKCGLVFAQVIRDQGKLSELDYHLFELTMGVFRECIREPDMVVMLSVSPDECQRRMKERNRDGEEEIPLEYLQSIHRYYAEAFREEANNNRLFYYDNPTGAHKRSLDPALCKVVTSLFENIDGIRVVS